MADVIITLDLDGKNVNKKLNKFEKDSKKSGKKAGKNFSASFSTQSKKSLIGFKTLAVSIGATLAAAFSGKKLIEAAAQQQDAINDLNSALKITGKFTEQASQDFQVYASSLQEVSKFGDEVILTNAALIQSLGDLETDALKGATQAALDMSAALGIDLTAAATLVGKAAAGEVGSFSRFGVSIKKGSDNAETFSNALTALNTKFGGAAAAQVNTFSGATQQLSNTFGDLLEKLGDTIIKNKAVLGTVQTLNGIFKQLQDLVLANQDTLTAFVKEGILQVVNGFGFLGIKALEIIKNFLTFKQVFVELEIVFDNFLGTLVQKTVGALASLPLIGDKFKSLNEGLIQSNKDRIQQISDDDQVAFDNKINGLIDAQQFLKDSLDQINSSVSNSSSGLLEDDTDKKPEIETDVIAEPVAGLSEIFQGVQDDWTKNSKSMVKTTKDMSKSITGTLIGGLGKGAASAFASMGAAMAKGEDSMKAFAQAMMGMIGDIALQMGASFMAQGAAMLFAPGTQAAAGPLIAAGAGLSALGGAIKALSGGKGGVGGSAPAGGVASGGGVDVQGPSTDLLTVNELEPKEPDTNIALNIQGDILDSDDSGLRILDLLNNAFDKQGVVISNNARFA